MATDYRNTEIPPSTSSFGTPGALVYELFTVRHCAGCRPSFLTPTPEVLQLCSHPVVGWLDAHPGLFGLRSFQVAAIRTGGHPACRGLVFASLALVSRRGGTPCRARPARRSRHGVAMGPALRPGNGTTFALEAQTDQRQLAGG